MPGAINEPSRLTSLALVVLGFWALTGCATSDTAVVDIRNDSFDPSAVEIPPGTTVTWHNHDARTHLIRPSDSDDSTWEGSEVSSGQKVSHTFTEPGEWTYEGEYRTSSEMIGVVVVTSSDEEDS